MLHRLVSPLPKHLLFLLAVLVWEPQEIHAQQNDFEKQHVADSLKFRFKSDSTWLYRKNPFRPYLNLDLRNAYVNNNFLSLAGLRAGIYLKSRHILGLGYYTLNQLSIFRSNKIKSYDFNSISYLTLFYEYTLFFADKFDILLPLELGYGTYHATIEEGAQNKNVSSNIIPTGFGIKLLLMPHAWVGLKLGVGYRYVWEQQSQIGLDGAYFTIGIRIDLHHIYRDFRYSKLKREYHRKLQSL